MTSGTMARLAANALAAAALVACSDRSPVTPSPAPHRPDNAVVLAQPAEGQYDLEFLWSGTE